MPKGDENGQGGVGYSDGENSAGTGQETSRDGRRDATVAGSASPSVSLNGLQSGKGNRRNKGKTESHLDLGRWTEATNDAVRLMSQTESAIRTLSDSYKKHSSGIREFDTVQKQLSELQQECAAKDEKITMQKIMIAGLTDLSQEKKVELKREHEAITNERTILDAEKESLKSFKETADKRAKAELAEQKLKGEKELAKLKLDLKTQFAEGKEKLKQEKKKLEDDNQKAISDLQANQTKLSEELEENRTALTKARAEFNDMRRLRDSFEAETDGLNVKLKTMENEFGLDSQGLGFYKKSFDDISTGIEDISMRYFTELSRDDFDAVHNELQAADSCFASVPISDSDASHSLRIAHAQRVISGVLCAIVWQPFPSEHVLHDPELIKKLGEISAQVAKSNHGNGAGERAETVWTALTTRALQSLDPTSPSASHLTSQKSLAPGRVDKVVSEVLRVLVALVNPAQVTQFRNDVANLASLAISTWNCAQTGELKLSVCPTLSLAHQAEWHSKFDDGSLAGAVSSTRPRIFTLFPRIITKKFLMGVRPPDGPPGSWPESKQEPRALETCIHPGTGLREFSSLVIKGQEEEAERRAEEEERQKHIQETVDMLKKEWKPPSKRKGSSSTRESVAGLGAGPAGPIAQWRSEGRWRAVEE